jgi:hypothetical protein
MALALGRSGLSTGGEGQHMHDWLDPVLPPVLGLAPLLVWAQVLLALWQH